MRTAQGSYTSLIQGVSQQPAATRFEGQCEEQINMSSDATRGLCRRAPTEFIGWLSSLDSHDDWRFHDIALTDDQRYWVAYRPGTIKLFDVYTGEEVPVDNQAPYYLTGAECSFVTSLGVTYVADSSVVTRMSDAVDTNPWSTHILGQVLGGAFSRDMRVKVTFTKDGVRHTKAAAFNTGTGKDAADSARLDTSTLCTSIVGVCNTGIPEFTWTAHEDCFLGTPKEAGMTDINVVCTDGSNNVNLVGYCNTVTNVEQIPRMAPAGYRLTILGLGGSDADDYYLQYMPDKEGEWWAAGIWREVAEPGGKHSFSIATMPHQLVKDGDGFVFKQADWESRCAGDEDTNPTPSFIGYAIADVASFQGRLVFIPFSSTVVMSRTNKPLDFWAKSATVVSDSDPLDMESSFKEGLTLQRACLHNRDLVAFAGQAQCTVFGRNSLTPANASVVVSTSFKADLRAAPVETGSSVFFAVQYGQYSGIREFFTQPSSDANNSLSITSHIAQYLKGSVRNMAASTNFDTLVVTTDDEDHAVYCYQYTNTGEERAQAAWSKWYLHGNVMRMQFFESELHLILWRDGRYQTCHLNIDRVEDPGLTYQVHLDQKERQTATLTLTTENARKKVYVQGEGCPNPGLLAPVQEYADGGVTFMQDMQGGEVIYGYPYSSEFTPTRPFVRDSNGMPVLSSRLILRAFRLSFSNSGGFGARLVTPYANNEEVYFSPRIIGDVNNIIGSECVYSDTTNIPVRADPEYMKVSITCDEHTPLYITQLQWSGQISNRAAR